MRSEEFVATTRDKSLNRYGALVLTGLLEGQHGIHEGFPLRVHLSKHKKLL